MSEDFSDIDRLIENEPVTPMTGRLPGPDVLQDGVYDFQILAASLVKTPHTNESVFRMQLKTIGGPSVGVVLERVSLFPAEVPGRLGSRRHGDARLGRSPLGQARRAVGARKSAAPARSWSV
jgi:hypothetical protein